MAYVIHCSVVLVTEINRLTETLTSLINSKLCRFWCSFEPQTALVQFAYCLRTLIFICGMVLSVSE